MQNQIKQAYYSHAAKYSLSSTESSNAGVCAETSCDSWLWDPGGMGEDHPYHLQLPEQMLSQEKWRMSNNQGSSNFPISGICR